MKLLFFDAKPYDKQSFDEYLPDHPEIELEYTDTELTPRTASLAMGYEAICAFVNADLGKRTLQVLHHVGVRLILLRCAGFNHVDMEVARACGLCVMRVPGYSPEAVAEHAMALAMAVNRKLHKAYVRVRENNFSVSGLTGRDLCGKVAGIVGTGKIGLSMCRICRGFGMRVLAYDVRESSEAVRIGVEYCSLDVLLAQSDLISLHCPLTEGTHHLIRSETIAQMKPGVIFVNTSRGALVDTEDLIAGIRERRFHGVALDVYEEEGDNVFENREDDILASSVVARLLSFPNVIVTSHQGFLTAEALSAIAQTTLANASAYAEGTVIEENVVR